MVHLRGQNQFAQTKKVISSSCHHASNGCVLPFGANLVRNEAELVANAIVAFEQWLLQAETNVYQHTRIAVPLTHHTTYQFLPDSHQRLEASNSYISLLCHY